MPAAEVPSSFPRVQRTRSSPSADPAKQ